MTVRNYHILLQGIIKRHSESFYEYFFCIRNINSVTIAGFPGYEPLLYPNRNLRHILLLDPTVKKDLTA